MDRRSFFAAIAGIASYLAYGKTGISYTFPYGKQFLTCVRCKQKKKEPDNVESIYYDGAKYWPGYNTCNDCLHKKHTGGLVKNSKDTVPAMLIPGESFFKCGKCERIHSSPLYCYRCNAGKAEFEKLLKRINK